MRVIPLVLVFLAPLTYDPGVFDVMDAKRDVLLLGVSIWALYALSQRLTIPSGARLTAFFAILLLPTLRARTPFVQWQPALSHLWTLAWAFVLFRASWQHTQDKETNGTTPAPNEVAQQPFVLAMEHNPAARLWMGQLATAVICTSLLLSLVGILEVWRPGWFPWSGQFGRMPVSTMGNPNHLGAFLALALPFVLYKGGPWRFALLPLLATIAMTGSRLAVLTASLLLLLAAGAAFWQSRGKKKREGHKKRRKHKQRDALPQASTLLPLGCAALLLAASFIFVPQKSLRSVHSGRGGLAGRLHLLRCAIPMAKQAIPWGVGIGRFAQTFPPYRGKCLHKRPSFAETQHTILLHLHNDPVEILLEGGLLLLLLLILGAWRFWHTYRRSQRPTTPDETYRRICLWLVCFGFLFQSLGNFVFFVAPVALLAVLALAALSPLPRTPPQATPHRHDKLLQLVNMSILMLLILTNLYWGIRRNFAQRALAQSMERHHSRANAPLQRSIALFPSFRAYFQQGQLLAQHGQYKQAAASLRKALSLLPDPDIAETLARVHLAQQHNTKACQTLQSALTLDPFHKASNSLLQQLQCQPPPK